MRKITIILFIIILMFLLISGCRSNKTVVEKRDTTTVVNLSIGLDTSRTTQTTKITINKIDSAKTEITIHQKTLEISSSLSRQRRDTISNLKQIILDNLTPKIMTIERKKVKDSLKSIVRLEKEKTKQENGTPWKYIFFSLLSVVLGIVTIYIARIIKHIIKF